MEPEFITYQRFNDIVLANGLAELLDEHDIKYYVEEEVQAFNATFTYNDAKEYLVKIKGDDFEKVNELLKKDASESIDEVSEDYYLFSFTDDELMEVITKADEWNAFDVQLARKLLAKKGKDINDKEIADLNKKRIDELKVTEPPQTSWIIAGYIFALLGGILGFFIGWHLSTYKKTLPDGERIFAYSEGDRKQGRIVFYLSFVGLAVGLIYKLLPVFENN